MAARDARLEVGYRLVREVSDFSALERRKLRRADEPSAGARRIRRAESEVGVASLALPVVHALQQEHVSRRVGHARQHRDGRLAVREVFAEHRSARAVRGAPLELLLRKNLQHFGFLLDFGLKLPYMQNGPASFEAGPPGKTSAMHGVTTLRERGATTRCCRYTVSYAGDYTTSVPRVSYHTITNRASSAPYLSVVI